MIFDIHSQPFEAATKTKLEIFARYLESWLPVFIYRKPPLTINICDFFAGPGQDVIGVAGSPLIILRTINKFKDDIKKNKVKIKVLLNENNPKKFVALEKCVRAFVSANKMDQLIEIEYRQEDFKKLYLEKEESLIGCANLLFIDQNGIKQVSHDIFNKIINLDNTDFLFFISSSYFRRFASHKAFIKYHPDINPEEIKAAKYSEIHNIILNYYKNRIPAGNGTKLYPFTIKKDANIYGLIFGSKHPRGVSKFLDIAWKENAINGQANFDINEDNAIQDVLFGDRRFTKIELFKKNLKDLIVQKGDTTNIEILEYTYDAGHLPLHAVELLREMKELGEISYSGHPNISYNKVFGGEREEKHFILKKGID